MHSLAVIPFLLGLSAASAVPRDLSPRVADTSNDLVNGDCRDVTFIFARGSTETGNMGTIVGPQTCTGLQTALGAGKVACQGVGGAYTAGLPENFLPQNTSPAAISAATDMFNLANTKCPNTTIVAGGYSQGSAVIDGSIQALPGALKSKIKGAVVFGFTRNAQDNGQIPDYPQGQLKVFCATGDLVCDDSLVITAAHLSYGDNANDAATFLASKAN